MHPPRTPFLWRAIATWFGSGLSPKAPGTAGSVASLVLWGPMVLLGAPWWSLLLVSALLFGLGTLAADAVVRHEGKEDPQIVVVDEVVGMGITLCLAPPTWWALLLGFLLFRLFDITKPWPVSLADRKVKGGFGVMLDDVLAAGYALVVMVVLTVWVVPRLFPGVVP